MINRTRTNTSKLVLLGLMLPLLAMACRTVIPTSTPANSRSVPTPVSIEQPAAPPVAPIVLPSNITDEQSLLVNLYQRINPSVVNVTVYAKSNGELLPLGQGSGFVFDSNGNIVTNAHVIQDGEAWEVSFSDGSTHAAEVVGIDLNSDLAVVKVNDMPAGVSPLPLADMNTVAVGQTVIAIGNPFGLEGTLTKGIISALGRTIPALTPFSIPQAIQTDAAINPGNSGGPLLNLQGEVIGVNAQIETDGQNRANSGVGFAVPVSIVKLVVPQLVKNGKYEWAWMGVRGGTISPAIVQAMGLPIDKGAYLSEVMKNGPAEAAGLQGSSGTKTVDGRNVEVGGDVVIAIDGQPIKSFDDLLIYVAFQTQPGQQITVTVIRDGKQLDIPLKLELRPKQLDQ